jgi:hypothetical protein
MPKLTWKQQALANLISDISEDCYCAGWMSGIEYELWALLVDPTTKRDRGMSRVEDDDIATLREISNEIGGWIYWDDDDGKRFCPIGEWLVRYEKDTKRERAT